MKRKIVIEIEIEGSATLCSWECRGLSNRVCNVFQSELEKFWGEKKLSFYRLPECLAAEQKAKEGV